MPDLIAVLSRRWKMILGLTLAAAALALVAALLSPKKYLSTATALPANSVTFDKARIFNQNIEGLYSSLGSPDELDRIEGTAALDTIYIAAVEQHDLVKHYDIDGKNPVFKAAARLKKNATIGRSAYGELKVKVWDADPELAALLANDLLARLQAIHQRLRNESDAVVLRKLREDLQAKRSGQPQPPDHGSQTGSTDSASRGASRNPPAVNNEFGLASSEVFREQIREQERLIHQYELAMTATPQSLLVVERARPAITPDKPEVLSMVLAAAFGGLVLGLLLSLFLHSRKPAA